MNELRYQNHLSLENFGQETQERIAQSTITIFGIGGLGSVCSLYLTNAGVGIMNLVDYDTVDDTNLPRQVIYKPNQVGMNKAAAAKATGQNEGIIIRNVIKIDLIRWFLIKFYSRI